jgi:hypothetical protein
MIPLTGVFKRQEGQEIHHSLHQFVQEVNHTMRFFILILASGIIILTALTAVPEAPCAEIIVINTNDSGEGSLREALAEAEILPGPDTIVFGIPESDPGYNPETGIWTITPTYGYQVPSNTVVDGSIALADNGGVSRPGIEIDGTTQSQSGIIGFKLGEAVTMRGLIINHFGHGVWIEHANAMVEGCYVGTDAQGVSAKPNKMEGIMVTGGGINGIIQDNLVSGNEGQGICLFGEAISGYTVRDNRIGTKINGTEPLPNKNTGILLYAGAHDNILERNLVSGNEGIGIHFRDAGTSGNVVRDNLIGTDAHGMAALPNGSFGIALFNGPQNNVIGPGNHVAYNGNYGILVDGAGSFTSTIGNSITLNSITLNGSDGIRNFRGGNTELAPPVITAVTQDMISGTAAPEQRIEVYSDESDEGSVFIGADTTDTMGGFSVQIPGSLLLLPFFTATATDAAGNTSQFSLPSAMTSVETNETAKTPDQFNLCQNMPNPFNPVTVISYSLPEDVRVRMDVFNIHGEKVTSLVHSNQKSGFYTVTWNGRDDAGRPVSDGRYLCRFQAGDFYQTISMLLLK